jgi:hypothetical protein
LICYIVVHFHTRLTTRHDGEHRLSLVAVGRIATSKIA